MLTSKTVVLITGANRGIGKALLSAYLLRPNYTVIAGLRKPARAAADLHALPRGPGSAVFLVKIDSESETDAIAAVQKIVDLEIERLDIVIANAGISAYYGKASITPAVEMIEHFRVNAVAPLLLFQATAPILLPSPNPKFVVISSGAGSLAGAEDFPLQNTASGASKAAVNFVTRRIHTENPAVTAFPISAGWLQTDLGNYAARCAKLDAAPTLVEDGVNGIIEQIDKATREDTSGKFITYSGDELPW